MMIMRRKNPTLTIVGIVGEQWIATINKSALHAAGLSVLRVRPADVIMGTRKKFRSVNKSHPA